MKLFNKKFAKFSLSRFFTLRTGVRVVERFTPGKYVDNVKVSTGNLLTIITTKTGKV
jgi:hypothetical protein